MTIEEQIHLYVL